MLKPRLTLWHAALWVLLGGVLAQLAGTFVSELLRTWLHLHGTAAPGPSAWVVVPAMIASAATLTTVAILAPALAGVPAVQALGLRRAKPSTFIAAAVGTIMLGPTGDLLMRAMQAFAPSLSLGVVPMLHDLVRDIPFYVAWPAFALFPGVSEELVFRGLLQRAAPSGTGAILISGIAFSLFHIDPHHVAGVLPLGLFLAWVASRCGTFVTIAAHVANNTASIAMMHSDAFDVGYGTASPLPWLFIPVSLACVAFSARFIVRGSPHAVASPSGDPCNPGSEVNESWCRLPPC